MMTGHDEKFGKRAKQLFDDSVDELDAATLSRLNRGRHQAIDELGRPGLGWYRWVPAAGIAALTLVAVMVLLPGPQPVPGDALPGEVTDVEILLGEDAIEMLEDLEFYTWIDLAGDSGDVG